VQKKNILHKYLHCHHISYLRIMVLSYMQYLLQLNDYKDGNDVIYNEVCFVSYICGTQ